MFLKSNKNVRQPKIVNMEHVFEIKITRDNAICVIGGRDNDTVVAAYENNKQCEIALNMLWKSMELGKTLFEFPDEKQIQGVIANSYHEKERHLGGKKTKGHGGS